jgi:hypothetical protein
MKFLSALSISCGLIVSSGCVHPTSTWEWRHPDQQYAQKYKARDIEQCEQYAGIENMDGPGEFHTARDYGGWGDFPFEFCMQQRGWDMELVPLDAQKRRP